MEGFDKIRNMNLAEIDRPGDKKGEEDAGEQELPCDTEASSSHATRQEGREAENGAPEIMEPQGKYYEVDTLVTEEIMRSFLFGHYYRQPLIILLTIGGAVSLISGCLGALGVLSLNQSSSVVIWILCGLFILVWNPVSLLFRARSMVRKNEIYKETFHYMIDEWGIHLKVAKETYDIEWKHFTAVKQFKQTLVVYSGSRNGYLFPYKDLGDRKEEILSFANEMIQKNKGK